MSEPAAAVDLTGCDREPIHQLGTIQPIGFLVAVAANWNVERVSANVAEFTGRTATDLLGQPLQQLFEREALHKLKNRLLQMHGDDGVERLFSLSLLIDRPDDCFDCAVYRSGDVIVIEAEPAVLVEQGETAGLMRSLVARLDGIPDLPSFLQQGARQVHLLTGFDRVMVYRFDGDGSGEVVAEVVRPGIEPLMGLHYPASDIPQQARALYLRTPFRIICDVAAAPVPIVPALDDAREPLDLSLSILRAVSPVHIAYLANMGVSASLSVSIIVEGRLWGMFACHHFAPRRPGFELRTLCELFVQMFAMRLERHERSLASAALHAARAAGDRLLAAIAADVGVLQDPERLTAAIDGLLPNDGLAVALRGRTATSGDALPGDLLDRVIDRLTERAPASVFATDRLVDLLPEIAGREDLPAGLLAIPISVEPGEYVLLFRRPRTRSVIWAGNPNKPMIGVEGQGALSPRTSFAAWCEEVRGRSEPFSTSEVAMAETLRVSLIEVGLRLANAAVAERHRATLRQEVLIAELNHRVRNILALIGGLVRAGHDETIGVDDYIAMLEGRVQALARAHNHITQDNWGAAPLQQLFDTETGHHVASGRVVAHGPPVLLEPVAYSAVSLVVHELLTNSTKHGALSADGKVEVGWTVDDENDVALTWVERDGPPAVAPTKRGLGSIIIDHLIPNDLGGRAAIDYADAGLSARFCVPGRFVQSAPPEADVSEPAPHDHVTSATRKVALGSVLIVEDSMLIAIHLENILRELGNGPVTTVGSVADALREVERRRPDFAILDVNLNGENSVPIAVKLKTLGIPFFFATGYGVQLTLPTDQVDAVVVQKPYTPQTIASALEAIRQGNDGDLATTG